MANQAAINPTPDQRALRNIGRIKRLRESVAKNEDRGNKKKAASLQVELDRRLAEVQELKAALDELDA